MKSPFKFKYTAPAASTEKQPAIFLLHGLGSNEEDLFALVGDFKDQCHIFGLQGPIEHRPGYAFYTFDGEEGKPNRQVFDKVVSVTAAFIREAVQAYNLDPARLFVVGFNQGAVVAQALAVSMGDEIRGTAVLSGFLPQFVAEEYSLKHQGTSKMFISHGEYDYVYPYSWGQQSAYYFDQAGLDVTFKTYDEGHGVTPQNLQDLIAFLAENVATNMN